MADADVLLLLEGTYPYVRGGVSSWVHQIIRGVPELKFALIFIGGSRDHYGEQQYELPENVVHLEEHFLQESWQQQKSKRCPGNVDAFNKCQQMHDFFHQPHDELPDDLISDLLNMINDPDKGITHEDFLFSEASWQYMIHGYEKYCTEPSFVNYFWTVRSMHAPIFMLSKVARNAPRAPVIHSISTGFAGLLGGFLKHKNPDSNFILSEHGIYTKERKIDLSQAEWISDGASQLEVGLTEDAGYIRRLWISFYQQIGLMTYESSKPIVSLYEGNRSRQIEDGAKAERTMVIPNGISLSQYGGAMDNRPSEVPMVVGFVGRVVPIKDVKTFIRAMRTIVSSIPTAQGWIIGPTEEDEEYAAECTALTDGLGLSENIKFLGFQSIPGLCRFFTAVAEHNE